MLCAIIMTTTIILFSGACLGLTSSSMTVSEEDGEVMVCVELQKPSVLVNESSFVLYTQDGTALGNHSTTLLWYGRDKFQQRIPA